MPKTRVVALSMHDEAKMVEKMRQAGAESYVLKTAPSEELLAAIRGKGTDSCVTKPGAAAQPQGQRPPAPGQ